MKFLSKILLLVFILSLFTGGAAIASTSDKGPVYKAMAAVYEEEPNDNEDSADEFDLDDQVYGSFSDAEDNDNYVISIEEPGYLVFTGVAGASNEFSKYFTIGVYDSEGNNLDWSTTKTIDGKEVQFLTCGVEPGDYYITVMTWDEDVNDYTDKIVDQDYTFTASMADSENPAVPVTGVALDKEELTLEDGDFEQLTGTVLPETASIQGVTWESADPSIVEVDEDGVITAKNPGTTTVTIKTEDGFFTDSVKVTVTAVPVTGVSLNKAILTLVAKRTEQLRAIIKPENASNKNVTWSSSNPAVVKVSPTGVLTGLAAGTANITVTTVDGGFKATCKVTVVMPVTGIKLNMTTKTLKVTQKVKLVAQIFPANATDKRVIWSTTNKAVALVDQTGTVTAKGRGTTVIYAKTPDGRFVASCKITVTK